MATIYTQQDKNVRKTWFLMGIFLVIVVALGYFLATVYQSPDILLIAIAFSVVMNVASFWYSDKLALSMARAVPADPANYRDLHNIVENIAITAGLPKPRVYVIHDGAMNAFATGRNAKHAAIAVTTGLISGLERNELEGVIAHEMAHIGNNDILLQSAVVVLVGFISLVADFFLWGGRGARIGGDDNKVGGALMIIGVVLVILSPIIATLIQLAISRKREYLADATGALLTRYPEGLANALRKISAQGQPLARASDATAHMYISNPFGKKGKFGLHALFMTHPPVEKRIAALTTMAL
jgi:heat shock protein HtpX